MINIISNKKYIRFLSFIEKTDTCWLWKGHIMKTGYGQFWNGNNKCYAHRWSYEFFKDNIKLKNQIDHLCKNRACVNPDHLEQVTQKENLYRGNGYSGKNYRKNNPFCKKGHLFSTKVRRCKICKSIYDKNRWKIISNNLLEEKGA